MLKNLFLLGILTWVSFTYAMRPVVKESLSEAESFKVEKPREEQSAQRAVAGGKFKKQKQSHEAWIETKETSDPDSEVRYWQYSE